MNLEDQFIQWENPKSIESLTYPVSREGHILLYSSLLQSLVMFGGMSSTRNNELFLYYIKKNYWEKIKTQGNHPQPRCYHQGFIKDQFLIIYGGQGEKNRSLGDVYVIDLIKKLSKKVHLKNSPISRVYFGSFYYDQFSEFYIFGGLNLPTNTFLNDMWSLDLKNANLEEKLEIQGAKWNQINQYGEIPSKRKGHLLIQYQNKFYIFGGIGLDPQEEMNSIFEFNLNKKFWKKLQIQLDFLSSRNNFGFSQISQKFVFIYGGINNKTKKTLKDLLLWNLETQQISQPYISGESPQQTKGHAMTTINDKNYNRIYLIGGVSDSIKGMDLYFINFYNKNKENHKWKQQIKKTEFETDVENKGYNCLFEIGKEQSKISDLILIENQKQAELKKILEQKELEYLELDENLQVQETNKIEILNKIQQQNESYKEMRNQLKDTIKLDESKEELYKDQIVISQDNFNKIFQYTDILDKTMIKLLSQLSKEREKNSKIKQLQTVLKENSQKVKSSQEKFYSHLQVMKQFIQDYINQQKLLKNEILQIEENSLCFKQFQIQKLIINAKQNQIKNAQNSYLKCLI